MSSESQHASVFSYRGATVKNIHEKITKDNMFINIDTDLVRKVFIFVGTNDASHIYWGHSYIDETINQTKTLIQYLKERFPRCNIKLVNLLHRGVKGENDVVKEINKRFHEYCSEDSNITFIETEAKHKLFSDGLGNIKHNFFFDNVHLSDHGIVRLARMLKYLAHNS